MTEPINKYQIQLNPKWKVLHSIIGHLYPAALPPLQFTIKLLRIVEINSMGLVKLWSNLDFSERECETMDSSYHTRNSGSISGKTEVTVKHWNRLPKMVVASPSLEIHKAGWARCWEACCHCTWSKQEAGLETLRILVHPQGFYSSKSFSLTVLEIGNGMCAYLSCLTLQKAPMLPHQTAFRAHKDILLYFPCQ